MDPSLQKLSIAQGLTLPFKVMWHLLSAFKDATWGQVAEASHHIRDDSIAAPPKVLLMIVVTVDFVLICAIWAVIHALLLPPKLLV
ncbi:MAG: hypothetical protein Q8P90_03860 [bacterium]|nr:hypothetical protein [bacterium]